MRVLVTGGAGFIGSHVVDALLARGDEVVVVDNLSSGYRKNLQHHLTPPKERFRFLEKDIADGLSLDSSSLDSVGPVDGIVHLAAQVSVVRSVADPFEDMHTNARGLVQVLEFARQHAVPPKVVYASSAATYGDTPQVPTPEDAPCLPLSPYGIHKLAGEYWLHFYGQTHGVPSTPLRFFNIFGPRQDPSSAYSGVISIFAKRAREGAPLTIYGDGEQSRDFVYVGDLVKVVMAGLDKRESTPPINVGTGRSISVQALAESIVALTGSSSSIGNADARAGDIRHSLAVTQRLHDLLGVEATTSLEEGLRKLLQSEGA